MLSIKCKIVMLQYQCEQLDKTFRLLYLFQGTEMFNFAHNRNIHLLKFLNLLFVNIKYHLYFVYF